VIVLDKQYWQLIDLPKQEPSENPTDYVNRIITHMDERIQDKPGDRPVKGGIGSLLGSTASLAERAKETNLMESLRNKSTEDLRKENERLYADIHRLIKKYQGLRELVQRLRTTYDSSKGYPIIPRYSMLKSMIKEILRAPGFAEICHEANE
uniref:Uncharacterized protein n=1 Tax=Plectus sambesii TaxID=2011161 RepID=A0A914WEZ0_9BILA